MNEPAATPIEHRHDWCSAGASLKPVLVLDDWLGPTAAILQCQYCGQHAFCFLVAWHGKQLGQRLYAVRELAESVAATYLHNVSRDYCDLTRKQLETSALLNAAAEATRLVQAELPDMIVSCSTHTDQHHAFVSWREIPEATDESWRRLTA